MLTGIGLACHSCLSADLLSLELTCGSSMQSYGQCTASLWQQVGVTYDWRLAVPLLEQRDGYFTKLKAAIEGTHKLHKQKVCHVDCCMQTRVISMVLLYTGCCVHLWFEACYNSLCLYANMLIRSLLSCTVQALFSCL